jgi:hypothetical protein
MLFHSEKAPKLKVKQQYTDKEKTLKQGIF